MNQNILEFVPSANGRSPKITSGDRAAATVPASASGDDLINILIVDDEPRNLTVLETVLDDPGYRLVRAESADEALLALLVEEFALLILDIRMPGVTGFQLAKMIKERRKTALVPIIFLTAYYNEDEHVLTGYDTGAVDYLHKPVNPAILRSKVAVFAELHRKSREVASANRALLAEVAERRRIVEQLRELNDTLELQIANRTEALREKEHFLRRVIDVSPGLLSVFDVVEKRTVFISQQVAAVLGFNADEVHAMGSEVVTSVMHPDDHPRFEEHLARVMALSDTENASFEFRTRDRAGAWRWFQSQDAVFARDAAGRVRQIVGTLLDITMRKRAEMSNKVLMAEVDHRAKNLLAVVQAVARLSASGGDPATFVQRLSERIGAICASHDLLVRSDWHGVQMMELVEVQLANFKDMIGTRLLLDGPPSMLTGAAAQSIGMALHELNTNAAKHGALSNGEGRVRISWQVTDAKEPMFEMCWLEEGGPKVARPDRMGFGHTVLGSMARMAVAGTAEVEFRESGICWRLSAPVATTLQNGGPSRIVRLDAL